LLHSQGRRPSTSRSLLQLVNMNTTPLPDNELTQAYDRLKEQLRAHLRRRGLEASAAADVVQDVFVRALDHQKAGKTISNVNGWLFAAVRNAGIDHLRAIRPTEPVEEDIAAETPDDIETHAAIANCMRPLAARLPKIYRDAIQSVDLDQRSMRDVAHCERVSLSAIKSRVSRGRRALRELLLRCCQIELQAGLVEAAKPLGNCSCAAEPQPDAGSRGP
jgi:RNA polymerase sigma-70 factor, ECF subfamily